MNDEATVFLVDDDPGELRLLATLIEANFPRVASFLSAADFLASYHDQPGCLVLDVSMPGMNGLEFYRRLTRDKIALPVIFVTAYADVRLAVEAMQLGAVNFLEKPVQEQALVDSIRRALAQDRQNRCLRARRQHIEACLAQLTNGEREVLALIIQGKMNKEIAAELDLSIRTVEDRRAKLMKKMGAQSLAELVQLVVLHRDNTSPTTVDDSIVSPLSLFPPVASGHPPKQAASPEDSAEDRRDGTCR